MKARRTRRAFGLGDTELFFDGGPSNPETWCGPESCLPLWRRLPPWALGLCQSFAVVRTTINRPASELLSNFRDLFDQGKLSDAEFRNIKTLLKERLQQELSGSGEPGYENQNRNAAQHDDKGSTDGAAPSEDWEDEE